MLTAIKAREIVEKARIQAIEEAKVIVTEDLPELLNAITDRAILGHQNIGHNLYYRLSGNKEAVIVISDLAVRILFQQWKNELQKLGYYVKPSDDNFYQFTVDWEDREEYP